MLQQISWKIYIPFSMLHDWRLRSLWIIHLNYCLLLFGPISKDHGINSSLALWKGGRVFSKIPSNYFHSVLAQTKFCSIGSCFLTMYDFPAKNAVFWSRPTLIVGREKKSCEDYETCFWRNFKDVHFDQKYELWARTLCTAER